MKKTVLEIKPEKLQTIMVEGRVNMLILAFKGGQKIIVNERRVLFTTTDGKVVNESKSFQDFIDFVVSVSKEPEEQNESPLN